MEGIRTIEDINDILRAGADKVAINTAATKDPDFIKEAFKTYGSSTIVVAIEVIKQMDGAYHIFTDAMEGNKLELMLFRGQKKWKI